ncbi:methylmalonyl-CoA mutase family protein [Comamonas sp. JC664]|uniref:methylmalonyl-CoA mutase family protein n=1 Tax=Comamonas sp. JC664 TaxID=2801917 RepID=UPI0017485EC6|nr:methylmalonyl-CoA mutase family protein [Comamonas sp. JC664]MBL0692516.1 methylmalonyl-CoA mutase small subunit [Comamonas sp. JC664]GHG92331.1 methylmalonyl-CoA mutase [Comamonas sp. KCTC 72670]
MAQEPLQIASEFPAPSVDDWRRLVDKDLKGKPFSVLQSQLEGGLSLQPLYTQQDAASAQTEPPGVAPYLRGTQALGLTEGGWMPCQEYSEPDVTQAANAIRTDLERGTWGVWLHLGETHGIRVPDAAAMGRLLAHAPLDTTHVHLEPEAEPLAAANLFLRAADQAGVARSALKGSLGVDPLGILARTGTLPRGLDATLAEAAPLVTSLREAAPGLRVLLVSTRAYADAGATAVHELAWAIATGVAYLRSLERAGVSPDVAARSIQFALSVGGQFFPEIARLRAARLLWAKAVAACGGSPEAQAMALHARTASSTKTQRDPWVNILRATAESFAAVVGGADSISTAPFDEPLGTPDDSARRLARNTQLILRDESSLNRVADPAGGSYYLEQLTQELARAAWAELRRIESVGGMARALTEGDVARVLEETNQARAKAVRTRKLPIVGVSEFPHLGEAPVSREPRPAPSHSAAPGAALPLRPVRVAEPFESLRDASDRHLAATGARPRAFMASLGTVAEHTARSTWTANVLAAGGIAPEDAHGFKDVADAAERFAASGAPLAVISGPDALYPEWIPALTAALKAKGARAVAVAGRPGEHEAAFRAAGVDVFLFAGADLFSLLSSLHQQLGVA